MITPIIVPMKVSVSDVQIPVSIAVSDVVLPVSIGTKIEVIAGDWYDGEYTVIPRLTEQMLETENKLMRDDLTIREIPVVSTSNPYGGQTVVIG